MQTLHLIISGIVQGVGFRQFVKKQAKRLGVTGWVRNIPQGRVEAVVHGDKETIAELVQVCHKGPMLSDVTEIQIKEQDNGEVYEDFIILSTIYHTSPK